MQRFFELIQDEPDSLVEPTRMRALMPMYAAEPAVQGAALKYMHGNPHMGASQKFLSQFWKS